MININQKKIQQINSILSNEIQIGDVICLNPSDASYNDMNFVKLTNINCKYYLLPCSYLGESLIENIGELISIDKLSKKNLKDLFLAS